MKQIVALLSILLLSNMAIGQVVGEIKLNAPNKERGSSLMKTLNDRQSSREMDTKALDIQDLSDLLWAANGVNRPDGRRTAPTAMNRQDIDLYVALPEGAYLYDANEHILRLVAGEDIRPLLAGPQEFIKSAPIVLIIVSDTAKFPAGIDGKLWGAFDAGIVSQNINLFCSAVGMKTVPRAYMDATKVKEALKLSEGQVVMLNNPVGYPK